MTTSDIHGNLHKDSGVVGAGQFSEKLNSAPAGTLTREEVLESNGIITRTAKAVVRGFRIDASNAEDVAQDAWVDLLKRKTRTNPQTRQKEDVTPRDLVKDPKLLNLITRTIAKRDYTLGGFDGLRHEDFRARRMLQEAEAEFVAQSGRKMTADERAAAANEIRLRAFAPQRRPREDFHVEYKRVPIDISSEDGGETLADTLVAEEPLGFDDQEDAAAMALHEVENGNASKLDVRRDVWKIVSIRNGAPQVVPRSVSGNAAREHRKLVDAAGGAHALTQKWLDGLTTGAQEDALFAPYGELDDAAREKVAEVLDDHPGFADHLWGEALKAASRR